MAKHFDVTVWDRNPRRVEPQVGRVAFVFERHARAYAEGIERQGKDIGRDYRAEVGECRMTDCEVI